MITENDLDTALKWFGRYGEWVVFFGRMIPIIRTLISVPAGLAKMNWLKFSLFTVVGTLLWNIILAFAGRILGENYTIVVDFIDEFKIVIVVLGVLAVAAFYAVRIYRRQTGKDLQNEDQTAK